jgi:hypothetical protein
MIDYKRHFKLGMVVQASNPSTLEDRVWGQPGLHSATLSQKPKQKEISETTEINDEINSELYTSKLMHIFLGMVSYVLYLWRKIYLLLEDAD